MSRPVLQGWIELGKCLRISRLADTDNEQESTENDGAVVHARRNSNARAYLCTQDPQECYAGRHFPASVARMYSRVIRAMLEMGISFGQTASHSPSFEQLPNPSLSACAIIAVTRWYRSCCPCGSRARCEIFALMKRWADAFLHAATQAPQPMHAAESIAASDTSFGIRMLFPSCAPPAFTET